MFRPVKLLLLLLWLFVCLVIGVAAKRMGKLAFRDRMSCLCHKGMLGIIGVRLHIHGEVADVRPLLLVANHISYLDIILLGSVFPLRFTPKSEVSKWPGVSALARASDAIFIDRKPEKVQESAQAIRSALQSGQVICLFPEATTGDGVHLRPFKSGMFSLAEEDANGRLLMVQPAALSYTRIRRLPIDSGQWPSIAWYGDMELAPHLWTLLGLGRIDVELSFLPAVTVHDAGGSRKALAAHCHQVIAHRLEEVRRSTPQAVVKSKWRFVSSAFRSKS